MLGAKKTDIPTKHTKQMKENESLCSIQSFSHSVSCRFYYVRTEKFPITKHMKYVKGDFFYKQNSFEFVL